ncbi:mitochondrial ribosomal protein [Metschnikowia bicuspidata]|uniref:Mitochondrial ribosomal protein n=1 Tax=Metschnikowia bicuspidata TaxID=27322 RepID=A0A4P9ZA39_9ASCO|nr:mitochondrial ribosomal protein [Metschnikowia bicuspidata]
MYAAFGTKSSDRWCKPSTVLPFHQNRQNNTFGQLVYAHGTDAQDSGNDVYSAPSEFRNADGSFIRGNTAQEARLDPRTLDARVDQGVVQLPLLLAKTIGQNILLRVSPAKLRQLAADIYVSMEKEQLQRAPALSLDADAHIGALFLQQYSHARRVLGELIKREDDRFNPQAVLDIGYGPGTGMIALNELMGDDFLPRVKDVYVVGRSNKEMKKRAKILLSRQLCEVPDASDAAAASNSLSGFVGPVETSRINIRTRIRDALPSTKQYDLIIVNQALLTREHNFPRDVDLNLEMILGLLLPGGHLVLIERGNTLGFETIARARQVMLRPESYKLERGRIPRPYIRGSSVKPQRLRHEDQLITDAHVAHEERLLAALDAEERDSRVSDFEAEINERHGAVSADELRFEFEDDANFEVTAVEEAAEPAESAHIDYHLSVVAPCPHHSACPLQLGDPKYYKISNHKHRFSFCSFDQVVERPKYTMELKRGKLLATAWDKRAHDGFGFDRISKSALKVLEGLGRRNSGNTESGSFSYLIMRREKNDAATVRTIETQREHHYDNNNSHDLPRVIEYPTRIKNNVKLKMCTLSGNVEVWQVPKSLGKQTYHDARKVRQGDMWALGKKSTVVRNRFSDEKLENLKRLASTNSKHARRAQQKKNTRKLVGVLADKFDWPEQIFDEVAAQLEQSKKYRTQGKRASYDVDPRDFDGK